MVISFSVKEAREQLLNEEFVYTYRWKRRAFFAKEKGMVENTWANTGRGTSSIGNVNIEEIGQLPIVGLHQYVSESGFDDTWGWQSKIIDMLGFPGLPDG